LSAENLPPFQVAAIAKGLLREEEMNQLIAEHMSVVGEGRLASGKPDPLIRRSQTVFLSPQKHEWIFRRLWEAAVELNRRFFCVDITHIESSVQLARYDSSDAGFYDWHTDFGDVAPGRKISISIQLSPPEDYEGGDLELLFRGQAEKLDRSRGTIVAFPSWVLHRVAPVTRGTRWSLVAWIVGPRWR
jgi:predicted 2-oxoglutarate/Fe(II)-dependent dioxygenase YbiX